MVLNRHYICHDNKHIHRKLFLCRECNKKCKPVDYVPFNGNKYLLIAQSYGCRDCSVKYRIGGDSHVTVAPWRAK